MKEIKKGEEKKDFDSVAHFREVKSKISKKLYGKSLEEIKEYFRKRKLKLAKA
ncbi:MAG: hypothetical protein WAT92_11395 [Saprospiraceae bacterium]